MIDEYVRKWLVKASAVGNLTFYAVEVRCPEEFYVPSIDEARECIAMARSIKEFVLAKLGVR